MIKRFIKNIEKTASEAWVAILFYIDKKLDEHDSRFERHKNRINKLDDRLTDLEENFKPVKTTVDSNTEKTKGYTKLIINTIIGAVILYILSRFGIG